jgi:ribose/xylose/arabinose/galactoside ABC-type transport system permease subunit
MSNDGPSYRNPLVTVLMFIVGIPLLLPGVCSFLFTWGGESNPVAALGFLISAGGVLLIIFGARRLLATPAPASVGEGAKLALLLVVLVLIVIVAVGVAMMLQTPWRNH